RDSGGFHANITARIITKIVLYLLSINSHLAALSSEILLLGTIVFLNKSFATICDNDTISPSEVDIIAERTATARNAAITGGNNSLNNTGMMESGFISASPPITAIPSIPPNAITGKNVAKIVVYINSFLRSLPSFTAINLLPKCGWIENGK